MSENAAKKKYDMEYAKAKLKRIPLDVQKEKYDEIKSAAEAAGESVNGYIKKAIDERMTADKTPEAGTHMDPSAHPEAAPVPISYPLRPGQLQRLDPLVPVRL